MNDFLYRGLLAGQDIRFSYALTTGISNHAVLVHECDPVAAHLLCRALTAGVLAAPLLSEDERFSLYWRYNGAFRNIIVELGAAADARCLIGEPHLIDKIENESQIYGTEGTVSVIRSLPTRQLNTGTVAAGLLDVVEDLAFFFSTSDQNETGMTVLIGFSPDVEKPVSLCQGMLLQALPGCNLERFDRLRRAMQEESFRALLATPPSADNHIERLVQALETLSGETASPPTVHECEGPTYDCGCSREKTLRVLQAMGEAELRQAIVDGETITIRCHFCNEAYLFGGEDLRRALDAL